MQVTISFNPRDSVSIDQAAETCRHFLAMLSPNKATGTRPTEPTAAKDPSLVKPADTVPTPAVEAPPSAVSPGTSYEAVKKAVLDCSRKHGFEKAAEVLKAFGVSKATELKPDSYPEVLTAFNAL